MNTFVSSDWSSLFEWISLAANFSANWLLQSTLLIAVGLLVGRLLKTRGSAAQSAVYRTTLVAILLCPFATLALSTAGVSGWSIKLPSAFVAETLPDSEEDKSQVEIPAVSEPSEQFLGQAQESLVPDQFANSQTPAIRSAMRRPAAEFGTAGGPELAGLQSGDFVSDLDADLSGIAVVEPESPSNQPLSKSLSLTGVTAIVWVSVWLLVSVVTLSRLALAWRRLWQLKHNSVEAELPLKLQCKDLSEQMGVVAPALLRTPFLPSPCLAGLRNPSILLPEEDCGLAMQDVLIHELAHLRRRDCFWNFLRRVATAIFFFQPLLWLLSQRIEISAEEVCDDVVVQFGGDRTEYANRLVGIAELSTAPIAAAGVGVVSLRSMLGHRVTRILDTSRTLSTRASNLILAVVLSCGIVGTAATGLLGLRNAPRANDESDSTGAVDEKGNQLESPLSFAGKVLKPNGQPAAGAQIYLLKDSLAGGEFSSKKKPLSITDSKGEFEFQVRGKDDIGILVAKMDRYGFAWSDAALFETNGELLQKIRDRMDTATNWQRSDFQRILDREGQPLQLTSNDDFISGELFDVEGLPLANVKVSLVEIYGSVDGDLTAWNKAVREPKADFYSARQETTEFMSGIKLRSLVEPVTTDDDGNFSIHGVGDGRIARLLLESPAIASQNIYVRTEQGKDIELLESYSYSTSKSDIYYANKFRLVAGPTTAITGVVRDAETKKPLAGVTIKSQKLHGDPMNGMGQDFVRTVTDSDGKYRLTGMPVGEDNRIAAIAPDGDVAYLAISRDAPIDGPNVKVEIDFDLPKGIWVEGKVTDKVTGEGLSGTLQYYVPMDSAKFNVARSMDVDLRDQMRADKDGKYKITVLPGLGYVTFMADDHTNFPRSEFIQKPDGSRGPAESMIAAAPSFLMPQSSHLVAEINPSADASRLELNLQLDSGIKLVGRVFGPNGKPVESFYYTGRLDGTFSTSWDRVDKGEFEIVGFDPSVGRTVYVVTNDLKHSARLQIRGQQDGEIEVKLQPAGMVTGRLVDDDGDPLVNARIWTVSPKVAMGARQFNIPPLPANVSHSSNALYEADENGRFEISGLVPNVDYFLKAFQRTEAGTLPKFSGPFEAPFHINPGESKDLGEVKLGDDEKIRAMIESRLNKSDLKPANSDQNHVTISGIVRDDRGQPVANAAVKVLQQPSGHSPTSNLIADTISDQLGKFRVLVNEKELRASRNIFDRLSVYACADGFGSDWMWPQDASACKDIKLILVEDNQPIAGKLIDLEGNPLEGVSVRISQISVPKTANLDQFFDSLKTGQLLSTAWNEHGDKRSPFFPPGFPKSLKTGSDGSFSIQGVGKERKVDLIIEGNGLAFTRTSILTRSMEPLVATDGPQMPGWAKDFTVYGSECVIPVPPSQTITGIVKDAKTGEPLAGVAVESYRMAERGISGGREIRVQTDSDGRYTLTGMPKGTGKQIIAVPNDEQSYLMRTFDVPNPMGMEPIELDLEMTRGVWISGKIIDTSTGKPLKDKEGLVYYFPYFSNSFAQAAPEFDENGNFYGYQQRYKLAADGSYKLVGLPGKAIVGALLPWEPYPQGQGFEQITGPKKNGRLQTWRVGVDPFEKFPTVLREVDINDELDRFELNFEVNPGKSIRVQMSGLNGKPMSNVRVYGHEIRSWWKEIPDSKFDAVGLKVGEKRTVLLHHPKERLGKVVQLTAEDADSQSLQVQLEPLITVRGQLVDKDGEPVVGAKIRFSPIQSRGFSKELERIFTDAEGRFENAEILPGADYTVMVESSRTGFATVAKRLEVSAGETIDLGTIDVSSDSRPEPVRNMSSAAPERPDLTKAQDSELESKKIIGNVVDENDRPVAGAHVALIGYSTVEEKEVVFGSGIADAYGKCELTCLGEIESDENPRRLIARKDGVALGWKVVRQLDLAEGESLEIKLSEGSTIKGRLVDIDGQPAAGEILIVEAMFDRNASQRSEETTVGFRLSRESSSQTLPEAWLPPIKTDKDGRFELAGIPENYGVYLRLSGSEKFAPQNISLNSGQPEQRGPRDGTYRPLVKNVEPGEEAVLTLAPAKIITGKVTYEDSDEPVPNAKISIWASQEEFGSMSSVYGKTDAEGNYRILPEPGIRFGVQAYPPAGVPYMGRQLERIKWENGDTTRDVDIKLPRVTLAKGRVVEKGTGKPVVGATITYESSGRTTPANAITGWQAQQKTDADGKFTYAVSTGRGTLVARKLDSHYVLQTMESRMTTIGQPGGTRFYANAFKTLDIEEGTDEIETEIEVLPGKTVRGVIVDEAGNSIDKAFIITSLKSWDLAGQWRGDSRPTLGGKFELTGLKPDETYKVHFLDAWQKLGTTIELKATDEEVKVVLQPCGSAKAKFVVDDENDRDKMRKMSAPSLFFTLNPGVAKFDFDSMRVGKLAADEEFIANVDRINYGFQNPTAPKLDDDFCVTFTALIPGATYRLQTTFDQSWGYKEFVAKSGETLDLGKFTPKFDR